MKNFSLLDCMILISLLGFFFNPGNYNSDGLITLLAGFVILLLLLVKFIAYFFKKQQNQ